MTRNRLVWSITLVAVAVFWLVSTSFRPWDLLDRAGFSADFYDEQARVLLRGRLAVDPAVPGPEGFVIDGSTYLYYGPFLAIVRLPFALFGDVFTGRLVRVSMLIALVIAIRWSARLAMAGRRTVGGTSDDSSHADDGRWAIGLFTAAVAFSPLLFAAGWITVYNETEIWAATLAIVTITLTVEWAAGGFAERRLIVLASLAALATTLTRAPIGLGVALAIGCCGLVLLIRRRSWDPVSGIAVAGGLVPLVAHAAVNFAKFGTLLSVPGDKQLLSLQNPVRAAFFDSTGGSFFAIDFLPTTLVQYLRPDAIRFERLVPFVRFGPLAENRGPIDVETVTPASSLPSSALLLVVLATAGAIWITRHRAKTWGLIVATTALATLPTFMIGFVANRYLIDILPPLVAAGAVGVWWVSAMTRDHRVVRFGLGALAVFGLWVNASLAIWNLELKSPGFTELRYDIDRVVFGPDSPNVRRIAVGDTPGRDGVLGVVDDCSAIYIAEQGSWVPLERTPGVRQVSGEITADDAQILASTDLWSLTYGDGTVTFERFDDEDGFVRSVPLESTASYEVIADAVEGLFYARVGDVGFFLPADVLTAGGPFIDPGGTAAASDNSADAIARATPLCAEITSGDSLPADP